MADLTPKELAAKLRGERFKPIGQQIAKASDPIADTAMVVTLDELRPYELNPRVVRNPRYDDIKISIRERGLEAPPPITKRPGAAHYIIRNGGNTRLSILNELWRETRDERFFRVTCLFRPWTERGEILALTGHLTENELRGELSFIERALGIEKLRELYEREADKTLTQKELSERLTQDGYPIGQSLISRMQDAIRYLLPSLPKVLYAGLGKHHVERLISLRSNAQRIFERYASTKTVSIDFDALFQEVSATFDPEPATFNIQRLQDELIGQMATLLGADYDELMLGLVDSEAWLQSMLSEQVTQAEMAPVASSTPAAARPGAGAQTRPGVVSRESGALQARLHRPLASVNETGKRLPQSDSPGRYAGTSVHRASSAPADTEGPGHGSDSTPPELGEEFGTPTAEGSGWVSFSELWDVAAPVHQSPLREQIRLLAMDIAREADVLHWIEAADDGIGFVCDSSKSSATELASLNIRMRAVLSLLSSLSFGHSIRQQSEPGAGVVDTLGPLLQGSFSNGNDHPTLERLSDEALLKLFRLIRLARKLVDLESAGAAYGDPISDSR